MGVLLTDGGEGAEEEEGTGEGEEGTGEGEEGTGEGEEGTGGEEEGTGVGVELREERGAFAELRTSVLASNLADILYRSLLRLLLALTSSFGADLDSRDAMTVQYAVIMRTRLR